MKVYVIEGSYDYESSTILAGFATREAADLEMARLAAVQASEPELPPVEEDWSEYHEKLKAWRKGLYDENNYDSYQLTELEIKA